MFQFEGKSYHHKGRRDMKVFHCPYCDKEGMTFCILEDHIKEVHTPKPTRVSSDPQKPMEYYE